jgi:hypothetical protein
MSLESARAKLIDPTKGALTAEEMLALVNATAQPVKTHGALTE